jgi:spore coat protein A, manganese oxidase
VPNSDVSCLAYRNLEGYLTEKSKPVVRRARKAAGPPERGSQVAEGQVWDAACGGGEVQLTRKEMLKLGLLGSAALVLPLERTARTRLRISNRLPQSSLPTPFEASFAMPPVAVPVRRTATTDFYQITMKAAQVEILPGKRTLIFGYDGITPGPTIKADIGRTVVVRQINQLPRIHPTLRYECTTSVHLHGNASEPQYDGWAEDLTPPGFFKDYVYPNEQDERTLWYHDHAIHHTAENAYMGLAAFYITDEGLNLPLPKGKYDVPLMIQDKIFAKSGQLIFDDGDSRGDHDSLFGDVILVNGKPWPVMKVERRKYLFRILNASLSRSFDVVLSTGDPMTVISSDGGMGPVPQTVQSFRLGMAERYGTVIDFAKYKIGQRVILKNRGLENNEDFPSTRQIMAFDVVSEATDTSNNEIPDELNPGNGHPFDPMNLQASDAVRTREFVFKREGGQWTINGKIFDPQRSDAAPALNSVEIWRFTNKSGGWFHPIHPHQQDFKILDRNGRPPFPYERHPKDTVYLGEGESIRVIMRFGPNKGKYMMHCHNIVHEDHDMMTNFDVGNTGIDPASIAPARPISEMPPL